MSIEIQNISKRFGDFVALDDITLQLPAGELTALLGPSGCGKTTLLRIIAGLEQPDQGRILLQGVDAARQHAGARRVGFVFQHYALFRHMTVFENVAFGLRVRPRRLRPNEAEIRERVMALLALVQLDWLASRYPAQLSGGQRQRIALARALAVEPQVLLLDEPFGALDAKVRKELRRWLRRLHDDLNVSSVFVTHDQEEALEVADRVVLMNHGRVEQSGTPAEVYEHPANPFVLGFLGHVNLFHGRLQNDGGLRTGECTLSTKAGLVATSTDSRDAVAYVRPHEFDVDRYTPGAEGMAVILRRVSLLGPYAQLELERDDTDDVIDATIPVDLYHQARFQEGETLVIKPRRMQVFAAS